MTLIKALRQQATACAELGSPFMAQLLEMLADTWRSDGPLGEFCASFSGDIGPGGASLPLRLAGALHAVVLTGRDDDLRDAYPPAQVASSTLARVVWHTIDRHSGFIMEWMASPPQTNEVRRSAVLIAAAHYLAAHHHALPLVTSELGASAGLNLGWHRYGLRLPQGTLLGPKDPVLTLSPDWRKGTPDASDVRLVQRRGVDLNPLDPTDPDQALRLCSYLWADQPDRIALTRAAISARTDAVDRSDAVDWLSRRLTGTQEGNLHLIYHTIAWQYFPAERQKTGTAMIEAAGARATGAQPLAWLSYEADTAAPGAALTLRLWPGDLRISLGRADFHGRWIDWSPTRLT